MRPAPLPLTVLWLLVFPVGTFEADLTGSKGKIQGESYLLVRSGPDAKESSVALPKEGEEVAREGDGRKGKPLPIVKVLEGREWEILRWLGAALCIFIIGWICGGNYYLRRDRFRRTKIRF